MVYQNEYAVSILKIRSDPNTEDPIQWWNVDRNIGMITQSNKDELNISRILVQCSLWECRFHILICTRTHTRIISLYPYSYSYSYSNRIIHILISIHILIRIVSLYPYSYSYSNRIIHILIRNHILFVIISLVVSYHCILIRTRTRIVSFISLFVSQRDKKYRILCAIPIN